MDLPGQGSGSAERYHKIFTELSSQKVEDDRPNLLPDKAANGNVITMVVGGDETVLGFDYGHRNPPYYSSRGPSNGEEPILSCQLTFQHHTEFPRKYVIPIVTE